MLFLAPVSAPPQAPSPETGVCCRWRQLGPLEGQDQARARGGQLPPSGWTLLPGPLTITSQGNGVPIPGDPPRAPHPPKPARAATFSVLSVLIFSCFLIKAIWG